MRNTLETRLGIFFALAFIAAVIIIEMVGGFDFIKGGYRLRTRFNTVHELKAGDPVKMAGVQIGRVENLGFAGNKVEVTLKVERGAVVKTDSQATIKFLGLLGQNYVSLSFGSPAAPPALTGAELATTEQVDFSNLMAKLDSAASGLEGLTKSFSGENFNNLLGPFTDFLKENKDKIGATIGHLQSISAQIAEGKGTVGKLINDDALYQSALETVTNFTETARDVRGMVGEAKTMITRISQGQGTLGKLTQDETLYKETTTAMTHLREIFEKVNRGQGTAGKLVNDESLYKNVRMTLQKVDKATEGLEDQGPLSVLGIAANSLF